VITIPESAITIPGIGDHVRPESVITMARNTHIVLIDGLLLVGWARTGQLPGDG
jgi:hypothetical protein